MKTAIIAVLIAISMGCFAVAIFGEEQAPDVKFAALVLWGQELENQATEWNDRCGSDDKVNTPQCVHAGMLFNQLQVFYIEVAQRYAQTGTDKFSELKYRVIQNEIKMFSWNINCGGKLQSKAESERCHAEAAKTDAEKAQLEKEINEWHDAQKGQKL